MDIASVFTTLITAMTGVDPIVYLAMIVTFGIGYFWWQDRRDFNETRAKADVRFDEMVKAKDARFDAHVASTQTALDSANTQLSALNAQYSASNKDAAEVIARIADALQTVARTLTGVGLEEPEFDEPRPRRRGRTD